MKFLKPILFLISLIIIIPLGIVSRVFNLIHLGINNFMLHYKAYFENTYIKYWKQSFNVESKLATWEIQNGFLDEKDGIVEINTAKTAPITFMYFKGESSGPDVTINITEEELEDLLEFAKTLNKKVIKRSPKNANT